MTAALERAGETGTTTSPPSAETVETFRAFRRALVLKFKTANEVESEAFNFIYDSVNAGVERRAVLNVLANKDLRSALGGGAVSTDDPALLRAYLDARRGMCPPPTVTRENDRTPPQVIATRVTVKLVNDASAFVKAAGSNYRVCESIATSDVLIAMRRFDPPIPGVDELSLAECRAYANTWDSSDYLHKKRDAWYVHDFNRFVRFAEAEKDAREGACDGTTATPEGKKRSIQRGDDASDGERRARDAAETVRRQAYDRVRQKNQDAFRDARKARRIREGEALVKCLREEMAVYVAQRAPAVGGVDACHAFEVVFEPNRGCVGRLTPEPTLALALAASAGSAPRGGDATGHVTPSEARLAFAQCGVAMTALEVATLGDHLARVGARSTRIRWDINELLDALGCDRLPTEDGPATVRAWTASATRVIEAEYLQAGASNDTSKELLRYLAAPVEVAFGAPAIVKVVDACVAGFRELARFFAALENELDVSSGGGRGSGAVSLTNVRYAARMANCVTPSTTRDARLRTIARAFPAVRKYCVVRETGAKESRVDWRAFLEACGPSAALVDQEKAAGAAPGAVLSLKLAEACVLHEKRDDAQTGRAPDIESGSVIDADDSAFDDDVFAVCASLARRLFGRVGTLRRALERADARDTGYLPVETFSAAIAAAGFGPRAFGPDESRWALAACHHPSIENAVVYPKYLAMVAVGIEREVRRRADAAGAVARAGQAAVEQEDARRRAWAEEAVRVAAQVAETAAFQAEARLRSEHTAEMRWAADVARRGAAYRARASLETEF
jgi:hypothetical protein